MQTIRLPPATLGYCHSFCIKQLSADFQPSAPSYFLKFYPPPPYRYAWHAPVQNFFLLYRRHTTNSHLNQHDRVVIDIAEVVYVIFKVIQLTQNICITFVQGRTNVEDVGPTLYKCYTYVLCSLGKLFVRCNTFDKSLVYVERLSFLLVF